MKNATFRQLRVFSEVARQLSFVKAAQSLHLTPPAVTMQVRELEKHIGMPLFERSGRQVALTTVGEYMLVYARKMLSTLKDAEDAAARLQKLEVGTLTIGMVSTAKYFLPYLLAEWRKEHEGIDVKLVVGNREQLVDMLLGSEVDVAIMGQPPKDMAVRAEPFAAQPHVFVAPVNHPLANQRAMPIEALSGESFIVRESGSGTRAALERFLAPHQVKLLVSMELSSNEIIKHAVMAGLGLSFLSVHTVGMELENGLISVLDVDGA
ncbi:MAG: LysR family transcriptional regulator, partial [Burkholderiales bacterium]|nr:LysR family transcriptional regulator [Burkholderiales bacterium]